MFNGSGNIRDLPLMEADARVVIPLSRASKPSALVKVKEVTADPAGNNVHTSLLLVEKGRIIGGKVRFIMW